MLVCKFLQQPDSFNEAETYGAKFKIDAVLKLKQSEMHHPQRSRPPYLWQISPFLRNIRRLERTFERCAQYPLSWWVQSTYAHQNRKQLLGATTFCMNHDPRRKHIYGVRSLLPRSPLRTIGWLSGTSRSRTGPNPRNLSLRR